MTLKNRTRLYEFRLIDKSQIFSKSKSKIINKGIENYIINKKNSRIDYREKLKNKEYKCKFNKI